MDIWSWCFWYVKDWSLQSRGWDEWALLKGGSVFELQWPAHWRRSKACEFNSWPPSVSSPRLLHFLVSLVVPKKPARLQDFSFQSVICFLFRLKCGWFGVTQKSGEKKLWEEIPSSLQHWLLSRVEMQESGGQQTWDFPAVPLPTPQCYMLPSCLVKIHSGINWM